MNSVAPLRLKSEAYIPAAFPLGVMYVRGRGDFPLHSHEFSEITLIFKGQGVHFTDEREYRVQAGDVFFITGDERHGFRETAGFTQVNLMFQAEKLRLPRSELERLPGYHALFEVEPRARDARNFRGHLQLTPDQAGAVGALLAELHAELQSRSTGYRAMAISLLVQILIYLSRCYSRMRAPATRPLLQMGRVLGYFAEHSKEALTLPQVAEHVGLSGRTLQRQFVAALGMAPMEYLLRLRLSRACDLLRESRCSITEAAFQAGFRDSNYFSRQFRKFLGQSPREFRAALKLQKR